MLNMHSIRRAHPQRLRMQARQKQSPFVQARRRVYREVWVRRHPRHIEGLERLLAATRLCVDVGLWVHADDVNKLMLANAKLIAELG